MSEPRRLPVERQPLHLADAPEAERYEARLGDDPRLAGLVTYRLAEGRITLLHTEVQEGFEGQGIGSRLAAGVFDDVRKRGLKVLPKCPFIVRWLERHPEQHDILLRPLSTRDPRLGGGSLGPA